MINKNLFGAASTLVLEEPPHELWDAMASRLESTCTKQQLSLYAETFIPWLGKYGEVMKARPGETPQRAEEAIEMLKSNTAKSNISRGVALILTSQQNLQKYVDSLSNGMRELWRLVLRNNYVSHERAKKCLNVKGSLFNEQHGYYYYSSSGVTWNKRELGWFQTSSHLSRELSPYSYVHKSEKYITVSATIRNIFFDLFFPEVNDDMALAELPDDVEWRTIEFEVDSHKHFKLLSSLIQQGELPEKKKGLGAADMKRVAKKLCLEEFYPNSADDYKLNLRAYAYMQMLAINEQKNGNYKKKIITYEDTLRSLFSSFEKFNSYLPYIFYPHIKGLRQNSMQWGRQLRLCQMLLNMLNHEPHHWIGIDDLALRIVELESDGSTSYSTILVFNPNEEKATTDITNEYTQQFIAVEDYAHEFGYVGLQACAMMLCSLGMAEVALNEKQTGHTSPFDQVEYVRLTPLGRYALGVTATYDAPEQEHVAYFELDPDRLIIRSLVAPNPYAQLLMDTSVRISSNRFETSALSFLANCSSRSDVESKIQIFQQFIADKLPPLWQQFFQSLLQHCHPFNEDKTSYKRYTISPDNHDLIELITTDPVLRQIVIRAEGYRLLVKTEDLRKFETQLKKHGYLL